MTSSSARRARATADQGTTVVEMIVATMLLGVGVLAVLASLNAATNATAVADHRGAAVRVATTEIETLRSWPYDEVGISPTSRGYRPRFEGRRTVTDGAPRVEALGRVTVDGTEYSIQRYVTWASIRVGGSPIDEGYKIATVVVTWDDTAGSHSIRQDTGLYEADDDG